MGVWNEDTNIRIPGRCARTMCGLARGFPSLDFPIYPRSAPLPRGLCLPVGQPVGLGEHGVPRLRYDDAVVVGHILDRSELSRTLAAEQEEPLERSVLRRDVHGPTVEHVGERLDDDHPAVRGEEDRVLVGVVDPAVAGVPGVGGDVDRALGGPCPHKPEGGSLLPDDDVGLVGRTCRVRSGGASEDAGGDRDGQGDEMGKQRTHCVLLQDLTLKSAESKVFGLR